MTPDESLHYRALEARVRELERREGGLLMIWTQLFDVRPMPDEGAEDLILDELRKRGIGK